MEFIISAATDVGITKEVNQDSLTVQSIRTAQGNMVFALVCDGMGGLSSGELASATVIEAFKEWVRRDLPVLCRTAINETSIVAQWRALVERQSRLLMEYAKTHGGKMGTTVVAMLITESNYYLLNVGDSRAYEIKDSVRQLTTDQTYIEREMREGRMTLEEAKVHPYRNVLLQSCGSTVNVIPEMSTGVTQKDAVYMLCSDGFRHEISADEIFEWLQPDVAFSYETMDRNSKSLIELNKLRMESDNISVVLVRTY